MARTKRGKTANKRRKNILRHTKGFRWGRKSKYRLAKDAIFHAWQYGYRDRRAKKRDFRQLWQLRINAASRQQGLPYSKFAALLKKNKVVLDRKILSDLAQNNPEVFQKIVESIKE